MALVWLLASEAAWSQSQPKLVSNTGQADSATHGTFAQDHAQPFTTGPSPGGYWLTAVEIELSYAAGVTPPTPLISLYEGSIGLLVPDGANWDPGTLTSGTVRYTAPQDTKHNGYPLQANSTYTFQVSILGFEATADVSILTTSSTAEDGGAEPGWRIGNNRLVRAAADTTYPPGGDHDPLKIAFYGRAVNPQTEEPEPTTSSLRVTASCEPCEVPPGGEVRLTAKARHAEGDSLTYAWSAPGGSWNGETDGAVARWTAPSRPGEIPIQVWVSDGLSSRSATVTVTVGPQPVPALPTAGLAALAALLIGGARRIRRRRPPPGMVGP